MYSYRKIYREWKNERTDEKWNSLLPNTISKELKRWIVSFLFNYTLHGRCLEPIDTIKYLGVYRSKDLRWNDHARNITYKANTENTEFPQVSQTKSNLNTAHQLQPRRRLLTNLLCGLQLNTADHCGTSVLKPKLSHKLKWFRGEQLLELVTCYFIEFYI